jgi:hypothetical protein
MDTGVETSQAKQYCISGNYENPHGDVSHKKSCIVTMENQSVTLNQSLNYAKGIITGIHFQESPLMEYALTICIIQGHYFIRGKAMANYP